MLARSDDPWLPSHTCTTWVVNLLHAHGVSSLSLSWLALAGWLARWLASGGWLCGWLGGYGSCCCWLGGWLYGWLVAAGWLRGWLLAVLSDEADEADEEDDSGYGWLAGNQTKNPSKRNISLSVAELKARTSRRDAGRAAGINHRCAFRSSYSSCSGPVQGLLAGRAIAAIK